jgi:arsenical pump membrane protein
MTGPLTQAAAQTWPPFVLVAGLLVIGAVAASDGLFEVLGSRLARLPGGGVALLGYLLAMVAVVTVVLNLDTSVVFLTPIVLHAARRRALDERAFLYGTAFMSNAASLLLPGSNLTNLLVLSSDHVSGATFAARLLPAWVAAVTVTALVLIAWQWRMPGPSVSAAGSEPSPPLRPGLGLAGIVGSAALVVVLADPALPVLGLALAVAAGQVAVGRLSPAAVARAVSAPLLLGVLAVSVALGTLARVWGAPGHLMSSLSSWETAAVSAVASVLVNNLPAAMLFSSQAPPHPRALLLGLNLGPNLAITGSLSAILWLRVARGAGARPSVATYSRLGVILVPVSLGAALVALAVFAPQGLAA